MQDTRSQHPLCKIPDASAEAALEAAAAVPAARVVLGGIRFGEVTALAARIRALPNVWVDLSQVEHADGLGERWRPWVPTACCWEPMPRSSTCARRC